MNIFETKWHYLGQEVLIAARLEEIENERQREAAGKQAQPPVSPSEVPDEDADEED